MTELGNAVSENYDSVFNNSEAEQSESFQRQD